ncbi:hypothetical protein [Brevundimonas sp.]|uniref:DUF4870 family protein n=1 Tax=Brevundimonas sp. TaxID=1871086 RepID=UPI00260DF0B9|nr:hypothetical protein [Brevundimonas sp.]
MAEPGDPNAPQNSEQRAPESGSTHDVDHDDLIGFASPAALQGQMRAPAPPPAEPLIEPEPEPEAQEPVLLAPEPYPVVIPAPEIVGPPLTPAPPPAPEPIPQWARETPISEQPVGSFARRREQPAPIDGAMGLYNVYALILFAVPTLGVSALIALVAVTGRARPQGEVSASHFMFQQRTLWAGAVVALLGAILIAVGMGVFVLFILAVWLILRGAGGVMKLKAGRPIERPRAWLF